MNSLQRWLRQPQSVWLRRALFQVHLWAGLGAGIYILLICVTGSALVFNAELDQAFRRPPVLVDASSPRLSLDQLSNAVTKVYPDNESIQVWTNGEENQAVEVWIGIEGDTLQRLFDPYTGEELGPAVPLGIRALLLIAGFHDNLLFGDTGRVVNGIGSAFLVVLCMTGAIIWWPGIRQWKRSLFVDFKAGWKPLNWSLHSVIGFWTFLLVVIWGVSGVYLAFPNAFAAAVDYLQPPEDYPEAFDNGSRAGDITLRWLARLHFGRFAGWAVKALWVALGLAPVALFVTGAIMWWNRVLRPLWYTRRFPRGETFGASSNPVEAQVQIRE